jgi:tetratricopeptide (TPR) repeat protein
MSGPAAARRGKCAFVLVVALCGGCATYSDTLSKTHQAIERGDYQTGIRELNDLLGVDGYEQAPEEWTAQRPLAALERAVLLQAIEQYKYSARDLSSAETELDYLDLSADALGKIGEYVYSGSADKYKAPPTERLAINAFNMLNYLAVGDLEGAAVEARRFTVTRDYLQSIDQKSHGAFGSYLAGFVFEKLGEPDRALRYYEEALEAGDTEACREPVLRLSARSDYRGPRLRDYLSRVQPAGPNETSELSSNDDSAGDILMVFGLGRVSYKIPKRIPVGVALGYAGVSVTADPEILSHLILKVLVYPELVARDNAITGAGVNLDGRSAPVDLLTNLDAEIFREYETIKPKIMTAAITRMLARAAAAEGVRLLPRNKSDKGKSMGMLGALLTEAALIALDKPDTRSWTFLPAKAYICRARVPPGPHEIHVTLSGRIHETRTIRVDMPPGGFSVIAVTEPR